MIKSFLNLKEYALKNPDQTKIIKYIFDNFNFHKSVANKVLITGYYVPQIEGSLHKDSIYKYPLYSTPDDLVTINLDEQIKSKLTPEIPVINRGRLFKNNVSVPYYSRKQIDTDGILNKRGLEIIYLKDPLERFFAHIQGSVHITLKDGSSVLAAYDNKNGHPYRPIGKRLIELGLLQKNNVTMDTIKSVLRQNEDIQDDVLNWNPSYVFFKLTKDLAKGSLNTPVVKDISIATDQTLFPKSSLGLLNLNDEWILVANHDTGGAITGPDRVDFFFGQGDNAAKQASGLQSRGMVGFLSPKIQELIAQ
jgi:membrane-bound lytic murein transglycosylase A